MATVTSQTQALQVGLARADITPPVGIRSAGFASRGPLTAHHDPLLATALVVAEGDMWAALVACDLIGMEADTVAEVRSKVQGRTGIAPHAVTVACTHTHYGPRFSDKDAGPVEDVYRQNLVHLLAGVIAEAEGALRPARMGIGWGESNIGINRREKQPDGRVILGKNPDGPIDRSVGVLRIDTPDGDPIACAVNFQAHPVSQQSTTSHISADFPGQMRETVEQLTGAPTIFLQGACGNINAAIMEPRHDAARTLGVQLGCEAARVWETIEVAEVSGLKVCSTALDLPRLMYGSAELAQAQLDVLRQEAERLRGSEAQEGRLRWNQLRIDRVEAALASWQTGEPLEPITAELQAWRLGSLGIAAVPGEIFNQIGVRVKRHSPSEHTFFLSGCNDSIGYVPIPEAYAEGGYEVMHACRVDPEAAELITTGCLTLLDSP